MSRIINSRDLFDALEQKVFLAMQLSSVIIVLSPAPVYHPGGGSNKPGKNRFPSA
jgi:hypothetical protein